MEELVITWYLSEDYYITVELDDIYGVIDAVFFGRGYFPFITINNQ